MPVYKYRGVTEKGQVISNRIEMDNKQKVIDKLKENNIMPIDITQVGISLRKNNCDNDVIKLTLPFSVPLCIASSISETLILSLLITL